MLALGALAAGVENWQIPGVDGGTDCSGCGVAWNCPHLHRSGGTRVHCPVGRWQSLAMGVDDGITAFCSLRGGLVRS